MEKLVDDDSFGDSNEERRIFKETFLVNKIGGPVANYTDKNVAVSCEHAPLLTINEVLLRDSSNACGLSMSNGTKCKKSSLSQGVTENNPVKNTLNSSVVQIDSTSTVLHPGSDSSSPQDIFRVHEYSVLSAPPISNVSTAAADLCVYVSGEGDLQLNTESNLEDDGCKDSEVVKQVTSPASVITNDGSNPRSIENGNQENGELIGNISLHDARDQLFDVVTKLMGAKGWRVEVIHRACRAYKEKIYVHDETIKNVREFPKLWRLLGRSLSVNEKPEVVEINYKCWPDLGSFCKDVSLTLARHDLKIHPSATDPELALLWNILDPFVFVMFICRKVGPLRNATAIQSSRSIPLNAFVRNNGDLTFNEITPVQKKKPYKKRKIQPSVSCLATNNDSQNVNAGKGGILSPAEMSVEGLNPKKRKNARCKSIINSRHQDKGEFQNAGQIENDAEMSMFEKVTGMDDALFRSSLYDVHIDEIKEWCSQNEPAGRTEMVDQVFNNMENHIAIETGVFHDSNNKGAIFVSSGHKLLMPSGISLVEMEFLDSLDVSVNEDPSVRYKMLNVSMKEPENDFNSLHNVTVIWKEQEDFTRRKKTVEVDAVAAVSKGKPFGLSTQIEGEMPDDDILLSAIKKKSKKRGRPPKSGSASKLKVRSVKMKKKSKGRGRGRKLHPRSGGKGGHQEENEKCITSGARSPLSWLVDTGAVNLDDKIVYHNPQSNDVVKKGFLTKDGILCYCCSKVYSVSKFRLHAGANSPDACSNLFMESGTPYSLCQLTGWSPEYLKRKNHKRPTCGEDDDESDDICGLCGDGGDLVCCDNCPATFHKICLSNQELPEGDWYCSSCVCHICEEFSRAGSTKRLRCKQCEHKYHAACIMDENVIHEVTGDWFCSELCQKVHLDIRSRVGVMVPLTNGFLSTLLRCSHDDDDKYEKSNFHMHIKGDCNTKLAVALTIMEECFLSMIDSRTGIDMIPHMVYNFGSNFPRLDFQGFYTVILEKDDVVMCVATLRIHGSSIAEIPLVATCSKYRRQGMCRLLMASIEEMLKALKIEKIVMSAVPELVPTWVNGFGFQPVEEDEKSSLKTLNLVVFPGTVSLKKSLLQDEPILLVEQPKNSVDIVNTREAMPETNALQLSDWHPMWSEANTINP